MRDTRRVGDNRPLMRDSSVSLTLWPDLAVPFRWLPRHGEPFCIAEWFSQKIIKIMAYSPIYTAIVVTMVLLVEIFGVPFIGKP